MDDFFTLEEKNGAFFISIDIYCSLPETVFSGEIDQSLKKSSYQSGPIVTVCNAITSG